MYLQAVHCVKRGTVFPYIGPHIVKNCKVECYVSELCFVFRSNIVSIRHGAIPVCGWRLRPPHMEVASNMLNEQLPTANKGWSSSLRFGDWPKTVQFWKGNNLRNGIIIIVIIIIIFIYWNWVVTRWQWLFYMYTEYEIGYSKFKSGGLHEKHVVATWNVGNHLSICFYAQGNQEKLVSRWPVAGPSEYWLLASSPASKVKKANQGFVWDHRGKEPRGRTRHRLVNNITMDFQEKRCRTWTWLIWLSRGTDGKLFWKWWLTFWFHLNTVNFFTRDSVNFSRRTLLYVDNQLPWYNLFCTTNQFWEYRVDI